MLELRKTGGVLQTEYDFLWSYTRFEIERRPKQGDAQSCIQATGVRDSRRIQCYWRNSAYTPRQQKAMIPQSVDMAAPSEVCQMIYWWMTN